jgi:hypothetical protein
MLVKICQTVNLFFSKNFRRMKLKIFFANFQILGPLGCQGWVVIPQNVKKFKITALYCTQYTLHSTPTGCLRLFESDSH